MLDFNDDLSNGLAARLQKYLRWASGDPALSVADLTEPPVRGQSNETLFFRLRRGELDEAPERLVLKLTAVTPPPHTIPVASQCRLLTVLGDRTDVPVPTLRWCEPSPDVLGVPFFVMELVPGRAAPSWPPMHSQGWIAELPEADRGVIWRRGVEAMAAVHRLDTRDLELDFLGDNGTTDRAFHAALAQYSAQHDLWAGGNRNPVIDSALEWLGTQHIRDRHSRLCWGDARLGNLMFEGDTVSAVLDWEMAFLGSPESDLAWWLWADRFQSAGLDVERLSGIPSYDETIDLYQEISGIEVADLDVHDVFASVRAAVINLEIERLSRARAGRQSVVPGRDRVSRGLADQLLDRGAISSSEHRAFSGG
jgi:aminoglycoside phosphotransferase (APT) family kinase protein